MSHPAQSYLQNLTLFTSLSDSYGPRLSNQVCVSSFFLPSLDGFTRSIDERTLVYFADNHKQLLEAYVESGEGIDRAGGFAIQVTVA